ncbi:MAG: transcriptional regulator [Proteobacteria bacterium]|nr:MAG: transcriptional regulator [Pseudomonadota bacterium]
MTPFGERIRALRQARGLTQARMAADLGISAAYLSALEHGRRGRPSWSLVQAILGYFEIIWDEAEELQELARLSHPKLCIDTAGLSPKATLMVNRLARDVAKLNDDQLDRLTAILDEK